MVDIQKAKIDCDGFCTYYVDRFGKPAYKQAEYFFNKLSNMEKYKDKSIKLFYRNFSQFGPKWILEKKTN